MSRSTLYWLLLEYVRYNRESVAVWLSRSTLYWLLLKYVIYNRESVAVCLSRSTSRNIQLNTNIRINNTNCVLLLSIKILFLSIFHHIYHNFCFLHMECYKLYIYNYSVLLQHLYKSNHVGVLNLIMVYPVHYYTWLYTTIYMLLRYNYNTAATNITSSYIILLYYIKLSYKTEWEYIKI